MPTPLPRPFPVSGFARAAARVAVLWPQTGMLFQRTLLRLGLASVLTAGSLLAAGGFPATSRLLAEEWPAFRGPRGDGTSTESRAPLNWSSTKNIRWKAPLPGPGNGSPIVWGNRVFVTGPTADPVERALFCFDRRDGRLLWQKGVAYTAEDPTHRTNPQASSTPVTDGQRVIAWYGSAGVSCHDLEGKELWHRDLGVFRHIWGYGSSPVIHDGRVLINCGPGERSFLIALDIETGKTLWQVDEPGGASGDQGADEWIGSWSTPRIVRVAGGELVLVSQPHHVNAHDPATGKIAWTQEGLGKLVYTSPLIEGEIAVAMGGYHGPAIGLRLGSADAATKPQSLWRHDQKNPQRIGSGVIVDGKVYMANEQFLAQCLDLQTGRELWQARLPQGTIWASIVKIADRLYVTNQAGTTLVWKVNPEKLELLAENAVDETCNASLAVSNGELFLRTHGHLYCIAEPAP
ncbi:MAG TPA: serine/threonine protein kinase [Planctomycetaceae bacterium]|nr:serine/threonine protein kinase [Planctomycetaceae bacterium]